MRRSILAPAVATMLVALTSTIGASGVSGAYTCSSSSSCLSANQTAAAGSSGAGIKGAATNNFGVRGVSTNSTGTIGQSASDSFLEPGVEGESTTTTTGQGDAAGAFGLTGFLGGHSPYYGVVGLGASYGVIGQNSTSSTGTSYGVAGMDVTGLQAGVIGQTDVSSNGSSGSGVIGDLESTDSGVEPGYGVSGISSEAQQYADTSAQYGGYFTGNDFSGSGVDEYGVAGESSGDAIEFVNSQETGGIGYLGTPDYLFVGLSYDGSSSITIDNSANINTTGTVTTSGIDNTGDAKFSQKGASGSTLTAYGTRAAAPEMEDVGEAQLVNGRAIVNIDPKLADVIDRRSAYHVFLTPEGDSNGLYLAQKNSTTFAVAEQHGGRSTMSFEYRIVAKPYGHTAERLAFVRPHTLARPMPSHMHGKTKAASRRFAAARPLSLDRSLRKSLGAGRFQRMIANKRAELSIR